MTTSEQQAAGDTAAWKARADAVKARAFAAQQRDLSARMRAEAGSVRAEAARLRAEAALVRDDGARIRDGAARVRDGAALVRDDAARARDASSRKREEAFRKRIVAAAGAFNAEALQEIVEIDRAAADESRAAAGKDREAAALDRAAADKDRDAAERDRTAAMRDREAADKDAEAANRDAEAADTDRAAADSDREQAEQEARIAESRLAQNERLAFMGRLTASIAHEINNPLSALSSTLELISEATSKEELGTLLDDAKLAVGRAARVVSDMRTWLGTGPTPTYAEVDPSVLVQESLGLIRERLDAVARVVIEVQPTPMLWGVRAQLEQVLTNLLLNAANSISGPREENEIRVSISSVGAMVQIEVRDSGSGIEPEALPHIFELFFTTREGSGGMGLGLALCERIVSEHGGTISTETKVGEGSIF
jgi:C4-dicarboxylate-specific signal transduction histidine kinase